ncbi:MAG: excinuclease ABC subunit A [Limisphaerales bacterium]|nr:MAG: excinuclease ABC subunit A [Limisphaerales bacterium]KAG0510094.1 MAG: excinuclease ABC subunit A [Limisphaerales bacterium]TXT52937.1 MAG: excinuclease ABC subunit A [Limisphaerales bacterium]
MSKPSPANFIRLRGVRHNNLKGFDLDLPLGKLIVITGLSGSGKSSLAFDTLFAEGQRRYIETFSPYARQFFDRMDKPAVDSIEGIPPAIAIEQRNAVRTTRSTVGTMTEICDHLKVLWPHLATLHCRKCGKPVEKEPPQKVWEVVAADVRRLHSNAERGTQNAECLVTFDLALSEKLSLKESLSLLAKQGYQRLLVSGEVVRLEDAAPKLRSAEHCSADASEPAQAEQCSALRQVPAALTVLQDRLRLTPAIRSRFIEACEQAYHFGKGRLAVHLLPSASPPDPRPQTLDPIPHSPSPIPFSNRFHCAPCDLDYREPSPALFSFNHPVGACPACKGFGRVIGIDYELAIPDRSLSLAAGAVKPWRTGTGAESLADLAKFCKKLGVPMDVPFRDLSEAHQRWVIEGDPGYDSNDPANAWPKKWYGVKGYFRWLESKSYKMHVRVLLSRYRSYTRCPSCEGRRFQPEALLYQVPVGDDVRSLHSNAERGTQSAEQKSETPHVVSYPRLTLADFYALPVTRALEVIESLAARFPQSAIGNRQSPIHHALEEVSSRLRYLAEVGLGYLTLDRATRTLSGGETERVNLTTCLGTRLVNTLYVLDEPSVGLHPRDTARLVVILQRLRDLGNTVIVVEHEAAVMRAADQIVDLGPGHGETGGELVFQGTLTELLKHPLSLTGQYLSGRMQVETRARRPIHGEAGEKVGKRESERGSTAHSPTFSPAHFLTLTGASAHNLKNLTISIPLGRFVCLTGVSGSGKSTLVRDCLLPAIQAKLQAAAKATDHPEATGEADDSPTEAPSPITHSPSPLSLTGAERLSRAILVDQTSLGKTPRSNPAVYIGAFDHLRDLFAATELAKQRGLNSSAFSFNSAVGQCDRCRGAGFEKIEMQFLSDVFIKCPACEGRRYREHVLEVKIEAVGKVISEEVISKKSPSRARSKSPLSTQSLITNYSWSIADLLAASVDESLAFLAALPDSKPAARAAAALRVLQEVGLGYLRLGQPINTLSGGESQRLKLAAHLAESVGDDVRSLTSKTTVDDIRAWAKERKAPPQTPDARPHPLPESQRLLTSSPTLFVFDEPTTGLHFDDVRVLVAVFQRLVDAGHTVLVIEHNLDVIRAADWLIDLGPEAGDAGGELVIAGTPEQVAACERSHTGAALRMSNAQ